MASATESYPQPANGNGNGIQLTETKRGQLLLGQLPSEFLRLQPAPRPQNSQDFRDGAIAQQMALQQQQAMTQTAALATTNRLTITVVEAKLNKNYGVTRMDPYCRIKVGRTVYETPTSQNGAKLPHWGKTIASSVQDDLQFIEIEIYDERAFSIDNRIAWGNINLTESLKKGKDEDDWWPLDGKLGEEKEGLIHIQLSWKKVQQPVYYNAPIPMLAPQVYNLGGPVVMPGQQHYFVPQGGSAYAGAQVAGVYGQQQSQTRLFTEQDLKQMKEMFPNVEDEVIKSVLEASRGNKDAAINSLLSMQ